MLKSIEPDGKAWPAGVPCPLPMFTLEQPPPERHVVSDHGGLRILGRRTLVLPETRTVDDRLMTLGLLCEVAHDAQRPSPDRATVWLQNGHGRIARLAVVRTGPTVHLDVAWAEPVGEEARHLVYGVIRQLADHQDAFEALGLTDSHAARDSD